MPIHRFNYKEHLLQLKNIHDQKHLHYLKHSLALLEL